ncbi:MAG: hypothetical protein IPK35_12510 [Saprospiraceae bacterium]|nr:hypothetical protein [Saprospiraceae bacterium]
MKTNNKMIVVVLLMIIGAFSRLIPHVPNFTPTEGITIFGVAFLGRKYLSIILPCVLIYLTDFVINNTVARSFFTEVEGTVWFSNYMIFNVISLVLVVFTTSIILKKINIVSVALAAILASVIFYVITNFGALFSPASLYTKDFSGLMQSYLAGLPFFRTSLFSNLMFTTIIFGSYYIINSISAIKLAKVKS